MSAGMGVGRCWYSLGGMWLNTSQTLSEWSVGFTNTCGHKSWPLPVLAQGHVVECWLNASQAVVRFTNPCKHKSWPMLVLAQGHVAEC